MGTITVNVTDDTEKLFRDTVKKELGEGKGTLGKALDEAMKKWADEKKQRDATERLIAKMEKGINLGIKKFNREEAYDRKIFFD